MTPAREYIKQVRERVEAVNTETKDAAGSWYSEDELIRMRFLPADADLIAHAPTDLEKLCQALELALEALEIVVSQFEDMQDSNDIREHWHKESREALTKINEVMNE